MPTEMTGDEYQETAHQLVNVAINDAVGQLQKHFVNEFALQSPSHHEDDNQQNIAEVGSKEKSFNDEKKEDRVCTPLLNCNAEKGEIPNIEWMTIDKFGKELAEEKIGEFIKKTWKYDNGWLFCTDYLGEVEAKYDMRYNFRVKWSIPTRRKPIPRATASVYFTFSVSKIKPGNYPVDVYYVFETNTFVHRPGHSVFKEKWLKDIIESKVQVLSVVNF